tara:strand:- start:2655 stop:5222 length:2568 start_codon:yes stop_codon:yes gene_type:complete
MAEQKQQPDRNSLVPQAYLMWHMGRSSKKNGLLSKSDAISRKYKYNFVRRVAGTYETENVVNRVHARPSQSPESTNLSNSFFNLENHKLSMLVPEIRLFRVDEDRFTPFYFPIVSDFDPLENSSADVGFVPAYAGGNSVIQNFNVKLKGTDPFTAKKYLEASLNIKVDSLANIFLLKPGYARLADLFTISIPGTKVRSDSGQKVKAGQLSRPIEIAAVLGYSVRDPEGVFSPLEIREIEKNTMSLRMNVTDHSISVQKDGTATISISYGARISAFDDNRHAFNIFGSAEDAMLEAQIKSMDPESIDDITKSAQEKAKKTALQERAARIKKMTDKAGEISKITEFLESRGRLFKVETNEKDLKIYYAPVKTEDADASTPDEVPVPASSERAPQSTGTPSSASEEQRKAALRRMQKLYTENRTYDFMLFGDMIEAFCRHREAILKTALTKIGKLDITNDQKSARSTVINKSLEDLGRIKILLPDIKLVFPQGNRSLPPPPKVYNLADLPISVEIYQKFVYNEMFNSKAQTYSLKSFLSDCVNKILPEAIGGFSNKAPYVVQNKGVVFASSTFTGKSLPPSLGASGLDIDRIEGPNHAAFSAPEKQDEYFLIYAEPDAETPSSRSGNEKNDFNKNVYHFHLGKDRGIIKNISFKKFTVPFRQEALMTNQIGLYDELKMPYSADITLFGNMLFYPGSQLYIDPFSLGFGDPRNKNSAAADLGLGGYYMVLTVDTSYSSSGVFETKLNCSFASWPSGGATGNVSSTPFQVPKLQDTREAQAESSDQDELNAPPDHQTDSEDPYIGMVTTAADLQALERSMQQSEDYRESRASRREQTTEAPAAPTPSRSSPTGGSGGYRS